MLAVFLLVFLEVSAYYCVALGRSSLAELPLEKLLNVKHALDSEDVSKILEGDPTPQEPDDYVDVEVEKDATDGGPMPLKGDWFQQKTRKNSKGKLPDRRGDWDWDKGKGDKKGDVSKIFQTTVTVLAFLAFGGYLLCMICMTIRNNQGLYQNFAAAVPAIVPAAPAATGRRKRSPVLIEESPFVDTIAHSLYHLSEGFTKYHLSRK